MKTRTKAKPPPKKKKKKRTAADFSEKDAGEYLAVECMGVPLAVCSNRREIIAEIENLLPEILPVEFRRIKRNRARHFFAAIFSESGLSLYDDEEPIFENAESSSSLIEILTSRIRMVTAEFAPRFAVLHAGVVGWKGEAIVIPGKSFSGKSTLVREFVDRGASYFSDEYAVIDEKGFAHPFPKKLSIRGIIDDFRQLDLSAEEIGGTVADEPLPVRHLIVSQFKKNGRKKVSPMSPGEGMMAMVENSMSVRRNPEFVLGVFRLVAREASVIRARRAEAHDFVDFFLKMIQNDKV